MKKIALVISALLSISATGCSGSFHETTYQDFISNKAPIDNSTVELKEGYLSIAEDSLDGFEVGIDYEEYYSSKYDECIRLYENSTFLYYSPLGAKSDCYFIKDNLFTVNFSYRNDFSTHDSFLFYVDGNKIVNLDKLSVSNSGFSFNGREFIHREKEQPIVSKYLYSYSKDFSYTIHFTQEGVFSQDELLKKYNLKRYKDYVESFYSYENTNQTNITFTLFDFSHILDDIHYFYKLNKRYKFQTFIYEIYTRLDGKRINITYYSLTEEDTLNDYQYYGAIDNFYYHELGELEDIDRLFASKQELIDFAEPIKDNEVGNFAGLKKLVNDVNDDMFDKHNLLVSRTIFNSTYVVRPFDGLYYKNKDLHIVLQPAGNGWMAITQVCYIFFIPKDLIYQSINFYY